MTDASQPDPDHADHAEQAEQAEQAEHAGRSRRAYLDDEDPAWVERASRLADAARELVEAVGLTAVEDADLETARADIERVTAALRERSRPHPLRRRPPGGGSRGSAGASHLDQREDGGGSRGSAGASHLDQREGDGGYVHDFTSRPTSAFHPVLPMSYDGERLTATWTASAAHEGPPGHLHGGVSAWHLDAILGTAANLLATPSVTATLEVRYRRPVPVGVPLELVATPGRCTDRRIVVDGTISAGGETCVEGRGVFVRLDRPRGSTGSDPRDE